MKKTGILVGVLGILIIVSVLVMQKPGELSTTGEGELLFKVDSSAVSKIRIQFPLNTIALEKRGTEWMLTEPLVYKAEQSLVEQLIHQIKSVRVKALVSDKPEKHSLFRVDTLAPRITFWQQDNLTADCYLGKMAQTYTQTYIRRTNENQVYLAEGIAEYMIRREVKDWRDKTIATTLRDNIKSITYRYGDTTFTVQFVDSVWTIGKEKVNEAVINSVLGSLVNLKADDFADTISVFPAVTAQIEYTGITLQWSYDKKLSKYYVRTLQTPQVYVIEQWRAEQLLKRKKDFLTP